MKSGSLPVTKSDGRGVNCVHGLHAKIPDFCLSASTMDAKNGREDTKLEPTDEKLVVLLRVILVPWPEKTSGTVNGKNHSHPPATEVLTSMATCHRSKTAIQLQSNCRPRLWKGPGRPGLQYLETNMECPKALVEVVQKLEAIGTPPKKIELCQLQG